MIVFENECVSCDYCINCGRRHMLVFVCDHCEEEVDELYDYEHEQLCPNCLLKKFKKIDPSQYE